ncbi:MAG: Trk system potassium transporter TrkA [Gemmatimonadetes bacterium]|nr:Trk system potassium transporter TrkA [Gemmatimonadota bacterium]NNM06289.1 Trk system potassium transporter TrkA [Gemmatimonadota bacterium]
MRVIIVGAGEVGFHLAERLSQENQDVVVIEMDPDRAERATELLDVMTVVGNGASIPILEKAGIRGAGILLAVTSKDEVNLISCLAANRMRVDYTIARISNPDYYARGSVLSRERLGIDLMINPEREAARETFQLLQSAAATDVANFAHGQVQLVGLVVKEGADVAGKSVARLAAELKDFHFVLAAIVRDGETTIPDGSSRVEAGDHIYVLAPTSEVSSIPPLAGYEPFDLKRVMIAGGSAEGLFLAELLEQNGVECTILDKDRKRCIELAEALPKSLVLHGDATDTELLEMEGVSGLDGYVAATSHDETNMLSALVAKSVGARKVVSLIEKFEYLPLVPRVGLDAAVSPRMSAVNAILRYVRKGRVMTVATLKGIDAEAIEFKVSKNAEIAHKTLAELPFPPGGIIGTITRGDEILIPRGEDIVLPGDEVIVFALPEALPEIEKFFA